jgi:hypothetical protein
VLLVLAAYTTIRLLAESNTNVGVDIALVAVTGLIVGLIAYWRWGRINATIVQLQAAQANEAAVLIAAEQDRAEYERELAVTRAEYERKLAATRMAGEQDREQDRANYEKELSTAFEYYRQARGASDMRFAVTRLVGQLEQFIWRLEQAQLSAGEVEVFTTRLLGGFDSAMNHANRYYPNLGPLLAHSRRDVELVLSHARRGLSASTAKEDLAMVSAMAEQLERWIEQHRQIG